MDRLEELMTPIRESSIDLVRPDAKDENEVEVTVIDEKLIITHKGIVMAMTRDVLQNIINIIENYDSATIDEANAAARIVEMETIIHFISESKPEYPENDYTRKIACEMLEDWEVMSRFHKSGLIRYCEVVFKLGFIDLSEEKVREAIFYKIVKV